MADNLKPKAPLYSQEQDLRQDAEPPPDVVPETPETPGRVLKTIPIASGHILNAQYDDETETMIIEFNNGSRYRYSNVDSVVFTTFMDSPSKGNYLHKVIRQVCPCVKL